MRLSIKFLSIIFFCLYSELGESREPLGQRDLQEDVERELEDSQITLISSNYERFSIDSELLEQSNYLLERLHDSHDEEINLDIDSATLLHIIQYLQYKKDENLKNGDNEYVLNEEGEKISKIGVPIEHDINRVLDENDLAIVYKICGDERFDDGKPLVNLYNAAKKLQLDFLKKISIATIIQLEKVNQHNYQNSKNITHYFWQKMDRKSELVSEVLRYSPDKLTSFLALFWDKSGVKFLKRINPSSQA